MVAGNPCRRQVHLQPCSLPQRVREGIRAIPAEGSLCPDLRQVRNNSDSRSNTPTAREICGITSRTSSCWAPTALTISSRQRARRIPTSPTQGSRGAAVVREHHATGREALGLSEGLATAYKQLQPKRFDDLFMLEQGKLL